MAQHPLIGITANWVPDDKGRGKILPTSSFDYLQNNYSDAIARAGGTPVIIPNLGRDFWDLFDVILGKLDGLLLSGGGDIAPEFFGQERIIEADCDIRKRRDETELEILRRWDLLRPDAAILAICRGHQLLNVYYGGTLIQDFDICGKEVIPQEHRKSDSGRTEHEIEVFPETLLATIIGEGTHTVNSSHHQGIDKLAEGLKVGACARDGVIEAVEPNSLARWIISVQWHPEIMCNELSGKIFSAFIDACRECV